MVMDDTQFDSFLAWLQAFDPSTLTNEAEVESKFVVPLFQYLGYPETCRCPQYPLKTYAPGGHAKKGRKPSIDQVYFSTSKQAQQDADTSLLIVEAKEPGEAHLDEALEQARFYGYHLSPLFLVVTNAHRLLVIKRHRYRGEEQVLDVPLPQLQEQVTAKQLYRELHFEVAKRLKVQLADELTHTLYVDLMHGLESHPDLRDQLAKGDFERSRAQEGRRLTVTEPKAAVECDLPLAFGDGGCRVQFSSVLLQGLTCHLTHRQILESLMTGVDTPPQWETRRFVRKTTDGSFEARLGQTTVILSEQEASDLCACVDEVCHAYKASLVSTEETLQTWDYLPVSLRGFQLHGFHILTVQRWLWDLILRFAREFDIFEGTSPWHIFDAGHDRLRVLLDREIDKGYDENVLIYPSYDSSGRPQSTVDLLYCVEEDHYLAHEEEGDHLSWKQVVGPNGIWTAQYTEDWLSNQLIPRVLARYPLRRWLLQHAKRTHRPPYWTIDWSRDRDVPLAQATLPAHLAPYLHQIQGWFHIYGDCQVAASLLRPYYSALTDVVRHIDPSQLGPQYFGYISGYVFGAARRANNAESQAAEEQEFPASKEEEEGEEDLQGDEDRSPTHMMREIIQGLDGHVRRIHLVTHEGSNIADFVSSALIALLEHGTFHCGQEHLNAAREAICPLLDLSRFAERYVLRSPWE